MAQGKYAEAEISRVRLDELRRYEEHRRREAMVTYQVLGRTATDISNRRTVSSHSCVRVIFFWSFSSALFVSSNSPLRS